MATVTIHTSIQPARAKLYHWSQPATPWFAERDYYELEIETDQDRVVIFGDTLDDLRSILTPPATEERPAARVPS